MKRSKNVFLLLIVLLLLLFLLSLSANIRFILSSRASGNVQDFSVDNSYMSISPIEARADGAERIRLTIFILNDEGLGVPAKDVNINKAPEVVVDQVQMRTDNYGRAIFDLMSAKVGEYIIEAMVENTKVGEPIRVKFN